MSNNDKFFLGLDIGASSIKYGWGNCQFGLHHYSKCEFSDKSIAAFRDAVYHILNEARQSGFWNQFAGIGIGTPGTLDLQTGRIAGVNPNLPFWTDIDPRTLIPADLRLPVFADNDANLMCLAESWMRGSTELTVGVTVGSGIGCGMVQHGRVFRGEHGYAMELGHITVIPGGVKCTCGREGCVEAYASVDGIRNRLRRLGGVESAWSDLSLQEILCQKNEHPTLAKIMHEGCLSLCRGLACLIVLVDPAVIVLGGGAMDAGLYDLETVKATVSELLPHANQGKLRVEKALEGNRAGVLGAVILADNMLAPE